MVSVEQLAQAIDSRRLAEDWLAIRRDKGLPLTRTAWEAVEREAKKAGKTLAEAVRYAVEQGWAGFKAAWVEPDPAPPNGTGPPGGDGAGAQVYSANGVQTIRNAAAVADRLFGQEGDGSATG